MRQIFGMKILRQKLFGMTAAVFFVLLLLVISVFYRYKDGWLHISWEQAETIQKQLEREIGREEQLLDIELNGIYPYPELLKDLRNILESSSIEEYMAARLRNSSESSQSIRSFPMYVKSYIRNYDSTLYKISLESENIHNILKFDTENIEFQFQVPSESKSLLMNVSENVVLTRPVYDTFSNYEKMGEITFFYDSRKLLTLLESPSQLLAVALVDETGNQLFLTGNKQENAGFIEQILAAGTHTGELKEGLFNHIYYTVLDSQQYNYRLIAFVDSRMLIENNALRFLQSVLVMLAISFVFLFVFFLNIRYDYFFVTHIFESIESVKRREFEEKETHMLSTYRSNEYGHIAKELDEMCRTLKHHILREYQLKIKQQEAQMRALQSQINPHFLYNTLEIIRSIALVNNDRQAAEAMSALGSLYRDVIKGNQECTIQDEVNLLQKYLKLMQYRSMDQFIYQIHIDAEMLALKTVKFWMQPLSENFFAHGFENSRMNVMVIEGRTLETGYQLEIMDNGRGIPGEKLSEVNERLHLDEEMQGDSIGLSNVYMRLKYFYGNGLEIRLENNPEGGAKVCVWIPKGEENV